VLAAGDVRHASVKRVASAVGEGSIAIQQVQSLVADERLRSKRPTGDTAAPAASADAHYG
jgi:thioredoxin reductase (NADPH)